MAEPSSTLARAGLCFLAGVTGGILGTALTIQWIARETTRSLRSAPPPFGPSR